MSRNAAPFSLSCFSIAVAVLGMLGVARPAAAASYSFQTLTLPGAPVLDASAALAVNDLGQVLVQASNPTADYDFVDVNDLYDMTSGRYIALPDFPGSSPKSTSPQSINNSGVIVGNFHPVGGEWEGYIETSSGFSTLPNGGARFALATGINNRGTIVGAYGDGPILGFTLNTHSFSPVAFKGSKLYNNGIVGINDAGHIIGLAGLQTEADFNLSFLTLGTRLVSISVPGEKSTHVSGINNADTLVGSASNDGYNTSHGFIYQSGKYTLFDVPGAIATFAYGINNLGVIVGSFVDGVTLAANAFVATPTASEPAPEISIDAPGIPEPSAWSLIIGGFFVLGGTLRRRTASRDLPL